MNPQPLSATMIAEASPRKIEAGQHPLLLTMLLGPLFVLVWAMEPLYKSNQNTKFLHALANSGLGYLHEDWLANTKDGLPAFSLFIEGIMNSLGPVGFYIATALFIFTFLFCSISIFQIIAEGRNVKKRNIFVFLAVVFLLSLGDGVGGASLEGLAKQYILQSYLQPALFGILMVLAVLLFVRKQLLVAGLLIVISGIMHPGYVAPGGILLASFLINEFFFTEDNTAGRKLKASLIYGVSAALLAGHALYLKSLFPPTDPELYREAYEILTKQRISHHADPYEWLNIAAAVKLLICLAAALLLPAGRLRFAIRCGMISIVIFAALAFMPDGVIFRLVAPWRLSVVIVPLAVLSLTALAVIRLEEMQLFPASKGGLYQRLSLGIIVGCALAGGYTTYEKFSEAKPAYVDFVRNNLASGQQYLTNRGLMDFRLATGAPQYVSYKSHPYQDVELLEWQRRIDVADALFQGDSMDCTKLERVATEDGLTHLLTTRRDPAVSCPFAREIFAEKNTHIYRLELPKPAS